MFRFTRSKRWLPAVALTLATASGCKNGISVPVWNPFAKASESPTMSKSGDGYVQNNMPATPSTPTTWSNPFKKVGEAISSPFKKDETTAERTAENDPVALATKVGTPNSSLYVSMAKLHERSGKLSDAVAEYDKALDVNGQDLQALLGLARLYDRLGRYDEALIFYGRAAQIDKNDAAIQNDMGLCRLG